MKIKLHKIAAGVPHYWYSKRWSILMVDIVPFATYFGKPNL
jgi:hypothetical protein